MIDCHNFGQHATIHRVPGARIERLPDSAIALIKSSAAILSLNDVILELLKNSLDAKASKIEVVVDFVRGACVVEDNGLGILPGDFAEDGGLGKLYWTSKQHAPQLSLGRNGTFIASLAAMCLLTITSRHYQHFSQNTLTWHHCNVVERQLPASVSHWPFTKCGTRVTVRNLFGNLPVRVKHRYAALERKTEHGRLWDVLRRSIVNLMLGWRNEVQLKIRDKDNKLIDLFNTAENAVTPLQRQHDTAELRSGLSNHVLRLLTQARYVSIDEWASWVPVAASTDTVSIKGIISLIPAPNKNVQFVSIGIQPLFINAGLNELFGQVNRLFALSCFGINTDANENDIDAAGLDRTSVPGTKRRELEGRLQHHTKLSKGIDRHPMFYLNISFENSEQFDPLVNQTMGECGLLRHIIEVLDATITQWLSFHHFRPQRNGRQSPQKTTTRLSLQQTNVIVHQTAGQGLESRTRSNSRGGGYQVSGSSFLRIGNRKHSQETQSSRSLQTSTSGVFGERSRIRSGQSNFFDTFSTVSKPTSPTLFASNHAVNPSYATINQDCATLSVEPIAIGALNLGASSHVTSEPSNHVYSADDGDTTVLWTDQTTKKTHVLNTRTGCAMPSGRPLSRTQSANPVLLTTNIKSTKSIRLKPRSTTAGSDKTPWLDRVLEEWYNPTFMLSEKPVTRNLHGFENECSHQSMPKGARTLTLAKLSKESLRSVKVIAQVDKKFILVKLRDMPFTTEMLVLIDQHAADERIQVELLYEKLCTPVKAGSPASSYQSKLGQKARIDTTILNRPIQFNVSLQEYAHLVTYAEQFAAWGILYNLANLQHKKQQLGSSLDLPILSVVAIPSTISERCEGNPKLLISLLRSALWHFASTPHLTRHITPITSIAPTHGTEKKTTRSDWILQLATCPPALIDMVNSRACRSAIMFNDELSWEECDHLVGKLARCVFPFMCAHGRPSMVPLLDLKNSREYVEFESKERVLHEEDFAVSWKKWKSGV